MSDSSDEKDKRVFEFHEHLGEFQELVVDEDISLQKLLDSDVILLFIDRKRKRVWMWIGGKSSIKMKFMATQNSYRIRDNYAFGYRITSIDDGDESRVFKVFIGLEKQEDHTNEIIGPRYKGTSEDNKILETITEEGILLMLEKTPVPEGYERRLVIVNNEIYLFKTYEKDYIGSIIEEKRLVPLKEKVEDGLYLLEDYTTRLLFSCNKILLIDLLQKIKK